MAGIDKTNEFYVVASRLCYLASFYRPDDLPDHANEALTAFCEFAENNKEFNDKSEQARDYFDKMNSEIRTYRSKELITHLIKELTYE